MSWEYSEEKEKFKEVEHKEYSTHIATRYENEGCILAKDLAFKLRLDDVSLSLTGSTKSLNTQDVAEAGSC